LLSFSLRHSPEKSPDIVCERVTGDEQLARYDTPGLDDLSARFLKGCGTRIAVARRAARLLGNELEALANSLRLTAKCRAVQPIPHGWSGLAAYSALSGIGGDSLGPQLRRKVTPPSTEGRFADVQTLALLADRFDHQVHVWMLLIGVQQL
jgi:hypothetical protein